MNRIRYKIRIYEKESRDLVDVTDWIPAPANDFSFLDGQSR